MARQKLPVRKQTPADSTMEALDKELDARGYSGSPDSMPILRSNKPWSPPTKSQRRQMRYKEQVRKHPTREA